MHSHWDTIKGLGAIGAFVFAQVMDNAQSIDRALSRVSVAVAILVGLANLWSIWQKHRRRDSDDSDDGDG